MIKRPIIYVEGIDDKNVVIHLLKLNGFPGYEGDNPDQWPEGYAVINNEYKGVDALMESAGPLITNAVDEVIGFVIDADDKLQERWNAFRRFLVKAEYSPLPDAIPHKGYTGVSLSNRSRIGIWIMPDNSGEGKLEHFLEKMIHSGDSLFKHAVEATRQAKELDAKFSDLDKPKAEMHAWLAWQEKPGRPYGIAIKANYFNPQSRDALRFVAWVKKLIQFPE